MSADSDPSFAAFTAYLSAVSGNLARENATEHTHRPALKQLVEALEPGIVATNEPTRVDCGAPDFVVTRRDLPVGYIEAKNVGISLDDAERSDQLKRYRGSLSNLILTDYLVFRWFRDGELVADGRLAYPGLGSAKPRSDEEGATRVAGLFREFFAAEPPRVSRSDELAERLARLTRTIRDVVIKALEQDRGSSSALRQQLEAFRRVLVHDLSEPQFADMYAQTIGYGLFAARVNAKPSQRFTREHAAYDLPKTNPFLRKMFNHIAGLDLDDRITWVVNDLAELLNRADIDSILAGFTKRTRRNDPVVHFYENFLAAYDSTMREVRGVYYTPEPVVNYIVQSVNEILKSDFGLNDGLADNSMTDMPSPVGKGTERVHRVQVLDPATGTGTFLAEVMDTIHASFTGNEGMWPGYVHQHLLPRMYGFELLMAPYAIAHLKLGIRLRDSGYDVDDSERLQVYLTNSLEEAHDRERGQLTLFGAWLAEEADSASAVKRDRPVMVVLGNPPYSGESANKGKWITALMRGEDISTGSKTASYFEVEGHPLGERNPKWLNNDYVKFIRFAQWRIEQTGRGVLAMITDHGYLDNPTFRGMRQALVASFDDIYVLDLHGESRKGRNLTTNPRDENVFDIQQGVSIVLMVKREPGRRPGTVHFSERRGPRHSSADGATQGKYEWLADNDVASTRWEEAKAAPPFYLFRPLADEWAKEYGRCVSLTDVFSSYSVGVTTGRDKLAVSMSPQEALEKVQTFISPDVASETLAHDFRLTGRSGWNMLKAREKLRASGVDPRSIKPFLYRPFDLRHIYFDDAIVGRSRRDVMSSLERGDNIALCTNRQVNGEFRHVLCSSVIVNDCALSTATRERTYAFPLNKLRPPEIQLGHATEPGSETESNLSVEYADSPMKTFSYIYAMLHSPGYRSRYGEYLKHDFPKIPFTSDDELFDQLQNLGHLLIRLHLAQTVAPAITTYPIRGDNRVERVKYAPNSAEGSGRVSINVAQYFDGVSADVWAFCVGGYQPCDKWLRERKGRALSYDDLAEYQRIVATLSQTMNLMIRIDEAIHEQGGWPIQ